MIRISDWAKSFNITVEPAQAGPGETVYRVKDIFTTRDGSWEPSDKPGSVPTWARDAYLKYPKHAQYFDDAGADHHLFGAIVVGADRMQPFGTFHFWTYPDNGNHSDQRVKTSGWANIPVYGSSSFVPERGEHGPFAWMPKGVKADIVKGGGMPATWHVSMFAVWEAVEETAVVTPPVIIVPPPSLTLESLAAEVAALKKRFDAFQGD